MRKKEWIFAPLVSSSMSVNEILTIYLNVNRLLPEYFVILDEIYFSIRFLTWYQFQALIIVNIGPRVTSN